MQIDAHATTRQLTCEVQNFAVTMFLEFGSEQNEIFIASDDERKILREMELGSITTYNHPINKLVSGAAFTEIGLVGAGISNYTRIKLWGKITHRCRYFGSSLAWDYDNLRFSYPDSKKSWGQHGAQLGPTESRLAPFWRHTNLAIWVSLIEDMSWWRNNILHNSMCLLPDT